MIKLTDSAENEQSTTKNYIKERDVELQKQKNLCTYIDKYAYLNNDWV